MIGAASLVFTGITFLLAWLIASLFDVIGIEAIKDLLQEEWFGWMLAGFAFGGALGMLRERDALVATLQKLVMVVLSRAGAGAGRGAGRLPAVAALHRPQGPVGIGHSGDADAAAVGRGRDPAGQRGDRRRPRRAQRQQSGCAGRRWCSSSASCRWRSSPRCRWASGSTNMAGRPERIWGVVAVAIAIAYGAAAWWAVYKGRKDFDDPLRPLQTRLAIGLCGLALFLALPILDFGAISARSQLARLETRQGQGRGVRLDAPWRSTSGPTGRERLAEIAKSGAAGPAQARQGSARQRRIATSSSEETESVAQQVAARPAICAFCRRTSSCYR